MNHKKINNYSEIWQQCNKSTLLTNRMIQHTCYNYNGKNNEGFHGVD